MFSPVRNVSLGMAAVWLMAAAPVGASTLPDPVDRALSEAEAHSDLRLSFTMVFQWADGPEIV